MVSDAFQNIAPQICTSIHGKRTCVTCYHGTFISSYFIKNSQVLLSFYDLQMTKQTVKPDYIVESKTVIRMNCKVYEFFKPLGTY